MDETAFPAWSGDQVRDRFNAIPSILFYTRAAHSLGLWESERILIERHFPDRETALLEAGCGAGRVTLGLWKRGYHRITAFDFADELVDQARSLADRQGASIPFKVADATTVAASALDLPAGTAFEGALMMFNGLMQIPGRLNRREALRRLHGLCRSGAKLIFTTHDRDRSGDAKEWWKREAAKWANRLHDPRLTDFGDRHFEDESGEVFIHIPDRAEILADLSETGWIRREDAMRSEIAPESKEVQAFSDECRFWVAQRCS